MRFIASAELDTETPDEPPTRDEQLRLYVDLLPPDERHMVERVYFGQAPLAKAARELRVTRAIAERILWDAYQRLKDWLENGPPTVEEPVRGDDWLVMEPVVIDQCITEHPQWGRCQQPQAELSRCAAHYEWEFAAITPDSEYERKVVLGLIEPIQAKLSKSELRAVVVGRYRGDGRRIDVYVTADPVFGLESS